MCNTNFLQSAKILQLCKMQYVLEPAPYLLFVPRGSTLTYFTPNQSRLCFNNNGVIMQFHRPVHHMYWNYAT